MKTLLAWMLMLALLIPGAALAEGNITIFTWEGYFSDEILQQFTDETGIAVNFSPFASNDEMLVKLRAGGKYDIVLASDYALSILRTEGLLTALDKALLPNYANLNPAYLNQVFDPDGAYAIPYAAGSPMIVYDPSKVEGEITGFADLWDEQFVDSLALINDARVMIGATLKSLGYSYNTTDQAQLDEAAEKLKSLRPNVRVFDYDATYQYLLSGEVKVAYLFTPYAAIAQQTNPELKCVFPAEGIGFGIDAMVIPASSENAEAAHKFLDFMMRPEIAAQSAAWTLYLNPNAAADPLIPEELTGYDALNIPEDKLATKEFVEDVGEFEAVYQDIWTEFQMQ